MSFALMFVQEGVSLYTVSVKEGETASVAVPVAVTLSMVCSTVEVWRRPCTPTIAMRVASIVAEAMGFMMK